jgi:subtilisin family serine protease
MTSLPRVAGIVLSLVTASACAQPTSRSSALLAEPTFYMAADRRIELRPTDQFFALRVAAANADELRDRINASRVVQADRSELLDRYGILVLRRTKGSPDEAVAQALKQVGFKPENVPVFESKGIFLVLLNDFSLKLRGSTPACTIEKLAERYPQARFKRNKIAKGRYDLTFPDTSARAALDLINRLAQRERECAAFASPNFLMVFPRESLNPGAMLEPAPPPADFQSSGGTCSGSPNDPLLGQQWYLKNPTGIDIRASGAWAITTGTPDVVIAVIDDGVETTHPDFGEDPESKIDGQYDVISHDNDATPEGTLDGHGTAVAGLAAAATSNCLGISSIGWRSRIYAIRAYDGAIHSEYSIPDTVEEAIYKAMEAGVQVINISMSGGDTQPKIDEAIDAAIAAGITLVLSAGNNNAGVNYPANLSPTKTVIAVAATDESGKLKVPDSSDWTWGSNFGPEITVAAPGVDMVTTDRVGANGYSSDKYSLRFSGTSAAAPLVAGVAALLLSVRPNATPAMIRDWIRCGADELDPQGSGLRGLNATRSLQAAANGCESLRQPNPPSDLDSR